MNDFDFEELDKAVNSLAAKTHEEHGGASNLQTPNEPAKPIVPITPVPPKPHPEPQKVTVEPKESPSSPPVPQLSRPTGSRATRRGAFMDIVPPSPRKTPSRVAPTLQPASTPEDVKPEPLSTPPESPKPEPEITPVDLHKAEPTPDVLPELDKSEPVEARAEKNDDVRWPDPLDFHVDSILEDQPEEKPVQTSPFLAEAKVEKRPLGAFSMYKPEEPPEPRIESSEPPVVDELTPDADGTFSQPDTSTEPESAESKDEPAVASKEPDNPEPKAVHKPEPETEPTKPDMHSAAMMSIPQQYRTENKPTDKAKRPIFDTKEYHPPLLEAAVHDHHGGSMWSKLFIALVAFVLLGVAGYFVYLFVLAGK